MIVKLIGWEEGMQKISLTKLQMEFFELSLKEAKTNVDKLLDGNTIEIEVKSDTKAKHFIRKASDIGVLCYLAD